jgi:translation initiation factor IF-2
VTGKKRVFDLAKEYGLSGQELAAKLRDFGFTQIKSHMTALDDWEVMEVQARLEAYGIVPESKKGNGGASEGGLKIKRKVKPGAPALPEEPARASEEPPAASVAGKATPTARVKAILPAAPAADDPEQMLVEPEPISGAPFEESTEVAEPRKRAKARPPEVEEAQVPPLPPEAPPAVADAPVAEVPPPAMGVPTGQPDAEPDLFQPAAAKRRAGKVLGFIDPAQFQKQQPKKPESRRLRSSDDVVPDVMPTLGRDRGPGQVRGDTTRGPLTSQQMREREAGRFLRRKKSGPAADPRAGPRRSAASPIALPSSASPHSGVSVVITLPITLKKLANALAVKEGEVLKEAIKQLGLGINVNSLVDEETAILLAEEFQVELQVASEEAAEAALLRELAEGRASVGEEERVKRSPTVAVLGHVDHGKTTLIDNIRETRIAQGEAGGITQHIGAYQVTTEKGHTLTIIDTPGHAAFTSMRARGAKAVDVVVLVVAADDGVMPQTEEALNHARAAKVPIVVALNKCDKPDSKPERVMQQLAGMGLQAEAWGGETAMIQVSGLRGTGVQDLLERVFLESEVLELKSHPHGPARGVVLEAEIQQGKGKVAHLLIQDGVLKKGDVILAGEGYGKVRSIHDDRGREIKEALPSQPVEVAGLNELPSVGDHFYVVDSLEKAQAVAQERAREMRMLQQIERRKVSSENLLQEVAEQDKPVINLIVKADVQGSVEVLKHQIGTIHHEDVVVNLIHAGVGQVSESDVDLATTSKALILAFHTSANGKVRQMAERSGVNIKAYEVIYELLDDIKRLMEGELAPEVKEEVQGHAEIRRIFRSSKFGNIAGCFVLDGKILRASKARLLRDGQVVHTGPLASLRREKEDVKEVREGFECGILLKDYNDIQEGDVVEAFRVFEVKRTL